MKPTTSQQADATISDVRALLDGDPLDTVHLYRGHLAIVLGALDEARRERDEHRKTLASIGVVAEAPIAMRERVGMRVAARLLYEGAAEEFEATGARNCIEFEVSAKGRPDLRFAITRADGKAPLVLKEEAERERDEARAALAAAEMARDVAWVEASQIAADDGDAHEVTVRRALGVDRAREIIQAARDDADIAAAIRAAKGEIR